MRLIERPSPNHDARPDGAVIDTLVLHYTGMVSAEAALQRLSDPAAKVSAHLVIDEDGTVYRLVPDARRAWHAGVSAWRGRSGLNARSIGVELVNPGHEWGYRPYPEAQMRALLALAQDLVAAHAIPAVNVVGHSDIAAERKEDPGELFDWRRLAAAGIGLWSAPQGSEWPAPRGGEWPAPQGGEWPAPRGGEWPAPRGGEWPALQDAFPVPDRAEASALLRRIGYALPDDPPAILLRAHVLAFQRRFLPNDLNGALTPATRHRLAEMADIFDPPR